MFQDGRSNPDPLPSYKAIAGRSFGQTRLLRAATSYHYLVSGSFNPPSRVLFNVLSRYYCTIGLRMYLGLGGSASHINTGFPTHATQGILCVMRQHAYGAVTLYGCMFQNNSTYVTMTTTRTLTPHLPTVSRGIQFALFRVRSPLLPESHLLSCPPLTKMFQFRGFPFL